MRYRMSSWTMPGKISFGWIAWLICAACTSETTVAVDNKDKPIAEDTLSGSDDDTDSEEPPAVVDGAKASICDAVTYPDAMSNVERYMNVREFEAGRLTALFGRNILKIDDGEVETTSFDSSYNIDVNSDAIITDDNKLIAIYTEEDAEDPSRFDFVIIQKDEDTVDWQIRIPEKHYDPAPGNTDPLTGDGYKRPVFSLLDNTLTVAGLFTGTLTLAEGQAEEIVLGDPQGNAPLMFIARYDRSSAALIHAAAVDEGDLLVPASISLSSTGERITITGRPLGSWFDVFAVGQYSILGTPIWVDNTEVPVDEDIIPGEPGITPTTVFDRPGGGIYVHSTFYGIKYITDRFGAEITLDGPIWESDDGLEGILSLGHFIAAFDADGALLWAKNDIVDADYYNTSTAVSSVLLGEKLLVAGQLNGEITLGSGEPNETSLVVDLPVDDEDGISGQGRPYLAAYQPDGTLAWARIFDENFILGDVAVLQDDGIRVFGTFNTPLELTLPDEETTYREPGSDPELGVGLIIADVCPE